MLDIGVEFFERAFVEQHVKPFARGQLALGVLRVDALLPAPRGAAARRRSISAILADTGFSVRMGKRRLPVRQPSCKCECCKFAKIQLCKLWLDRLRSVLMVSGRGLSESTERGHVPAPAPRTVEEVLFDGTRQRIFAGTRLRQVRIGRGLKQAEFAAVLGISVSYLSQIEHDDRPLTRRAARSPAKALSARMGGGRGRRRRPQARCAARGRRRSAVRRRPASPRAARTRSASSSSRNSPTSSSRSMPPIAAPGQRSADHRRGADRRHRRGQPPAVGGGARLVPRRGQLCRQHRPRRRDARRTSCAARIPRPRVETIERRLARWSLGISIVYNQTQGAARFRRDDATPRDRPVATCRKPALSARAPAGGRSRLAERDRGGGRGVAARAPLRRANCSTSASPTMPRVRC